MQGIAIGKNIFTALSRTISFRNLIASHKFRVSIQNFIIYLNFNMSERSQEQKQFQPKKDRPIIPTLHSPSSLRPQVGELPKLEVPHNGSVKEAAEYYYREYLKLYRENSLLNNQLKTVLQEKNALAEKHNDLKKTNSDQEEKRKRYRRNANDIPRNFDCPYGSCQRAYGSEGSLTQHVKLKHQEYYESGDYQAKVSEGTGKKVQKDSD